DIPGCPAELTTLLRNALNPDPGARPSADTLHWDLGGISAADVPPPPTGAMPAEAVADNVRPVNTPVAAINSAATAPPVTGAPMSPGGYPGAPGGFPMMGTEPVTSVPNAGPLSPVPPPVTAQKTNTGLIAGIIGGVVVLLIAAGLGIFFIVHNSGGGGGGNNNAAGSSDASSTPAETNSDIENSDVTSSFPFYLLSKDLTPGEKVQLDNGTYYTDSSHTTYMQMFSSPTYTDLNGDGALDVAASLYFSGTEKQSYEDAWYGVYLGLWDTKSKKVEPVKWQVNWQLSCMTNPSISTAATANNQGVKVSFSSVNSCSATSGDTVSNTVYVNKDNLPVVKNDDITSATENCAAQENYGKSVSYKGKSPLVEPDKGAPKVSGKYDKATVWPKDQNGRGDYLLASIEWPGGKKGCGWVKKKDVKKK
ncbi:MAG TPA: hypothetical protein VE172_24705, partial [Stackebrandtia sp.]|nr:hypothetical protein [Stackebrandtia sp.]